MSGVVTREQLVVQLAAQILALDESAPRAVAVTGMSCAGKTTPPPRWPPWSTAPADRSYRWPTTTSTTRGSAATGWAGPRRRATWTTRSTRRRWAGWCSTRWPPAGHPSCPPSYDLAGDVPVDRAPVPVAAGSVVLVEGSFLLVPALAGRWDLSVFVVADAERVLERAVVRDADLGTPAEVREMYLRRYLAAESMHQERDDPWSHADVVVDLTDPAAPRLLS